MTWNKSEREALISNLLGKGSPFKHIVLVLKGQNYRCKKGNEISSRPWGDLLPWEWTPEHS